LNFDIIFYKMATFEDYVALGCPDQVEKPEYPLLIHLNQSDEFCNELRALQQKYFEGNLEEFSSRSPALTIFVPFSEVKHSARQLSEWNKEFNETSNKEFRNSHRIRISIGGVLFYIIQCSKLYNLHPCDEQQCDASHDTTDNAFYNPLDDDAKYELPHDEDEWYRFDPGSMQFKRKFNNRMKKIIIEKLARNIQFPWPHISQKYGTKENTDKLLADPYGFIICMRMYNKEWLPKQ
jgi:hypothetical protein